MCGSKPEYRDALVVHDCLNINAAKGKLDLHENTVVRKTRHCSACHKPL